jgi:hypothetical protein
MVEVGDRVLVESEKVGRATRSGQHSCWSLRTVRREVIGSSPWALRTSSAAAIALRRLQDVSTVCS